MARCIKPSLGPHQGRAQNPIRLFAAAYSFIQNNPGKIYSSRGGTDFQAIATVSKQGQRKGCKVIKFKTAKSEHWAYKKCWGRVTNFSGVHIDIYTEHIM